MVAPRALDLMPSLVWGMDEPFSDASMIPTWHVAHMARSHVTVALSGDGGDEAYAGDTTYSWAEAVRPAGRHSTSVAQATRRRLRSDAVRRRPRPQAAPGRARRGRSSPRGDVALPPAAAA
ncbi:MAG: hypothetical protein IPJ04_02065 [Candidatus Eisenbacteria bacterium]|nr:hypothetical protein [Candidatus Eisenbacteria bacterium]